MGIDGLLGSLVASKVGVFAANMTGNTSLGVVAGGAAGAALGVRSFDGHRCPNAADCSFQRSAGRL